MMPVRPPAASARTRTAGSQKRRRKWRRRAGVAVLVLLLLLLLRVRSRNPKVLAFLEDIRVGPLRKHRRRISTGSDGENGFALPGDYSPTLV